MKNKTTAQGLKVRPLAAADLKEADRIMRLAFGTFTGQPDPRTYKGDAGVVIPRWHADPSSAFAAELNGRLVGSNFAARWGSFGFIGPLSIDPACWDRGFARHLVAPAVERLDAWGVALGGLFTFPHSIKHISLYQKFGFRPRYLTVIFEKRVKGVCAADPEWSVLSGHSGADRRPMINACRELSDAIFSGLDLAPEVESIVSQGLGDVVLTWQQSRLAGFAACHVGPGTEAGSGACFVKFGAAAAGRGAGARFKSLLASCEAFAASRHADRIALGVNTARRQAYGEVLAAGYQMVRSGIAMFRPDLPGFNRAHDYVIDDLR